MPRPVENTLPNGKRTLAVIEEVLHERADHDEPAFLVISYRITIRHTCPEKLLVYLAFFLTAKALCHTMSDKFCDGS